MIKSVQYFSDEYLEECKKLTPEQIVKFLDDFRLIYYDAQKDTKSTLISMKVPNHLLSAFKTYAKLHKRPYQAIIKELMTDWLKQQAKK